MENLDRLLECLTNTYSETKEILEGRLCNARQLLVECPLLIKSPGKDFLLLNITKPHIKAIQLLVENGVDILVRDQKCRTVFHNAAEYMTEEDFLEMCHYLLVDRPVDNLLAVLTKGPKFEFKWDLESPKKFSHAGALITILHLMSNGVQVLTKENVNSVWQADQTLPIVQAKPFSELFFQNHSHDFNSLLSYGIAEGNFSVVSFLLYEDHSVGKTLKVILEVENRSFLTCIAVAFKQMEMLEYLVSRGESVEYDGRTILHEAAITEDPGIFHRVVEILGKLWAQSSEGHTYSGAYTQSTMAEIWKPDHENETPLHVVCRWMDLSAETLDLLLACGKPHSLQKLEPSAIDINAVNQDGDTALLIALIRRRSLELIKLLVSRGADWRIKEQFGANVIHLCSSFGLAEHLKYFVELGCNVNEADENGNNALQRAVRDCKNLEGLFDLIKILKRVGVNISNKNKKGETAYDMAVNKGHTAKILELLIPSSNQSNFVSSKLIVTKTKRTSRCTHL